MSVISLRLKDSESKRINELSKTENKDRSSVTRELIDFGWTYLMIKRYREGVISLETLAQKLDISIGDAIDLLTEHGVEAPIAFEDYLQGFETIKELRQR